MKRWLKRIAMGAVVFALAGWLTLVFLLRQWTAKPPPLPRDVSITRLNSEPMPDGKMRIGECWGERREGLLVVRLKGRPFDMGYASARLLCEQTHAFQPSVLQLSSVSYCDERVTIALGRLFHLFNQCAHQILATL